MGGQGLTAWGDPALALFAVAGDVGPLLSTFVVGLFLAFVFGAIAHRLGVSPPVGYLLAGVVIGPFTPGYVADTELALELSELGVILLMFGVGLHFSFRDLMAVRRIAIPGSVAQIAVATALGWALALWMGWGSEAGFVFGLSLSVASTVVLLRTLQERRLLDDHRGQIAVGWLIVEDLAMIIALVLIPVVAGEGNLITGLALTIVKIGGFTVSMVVVGRRVIPWALQWVAGTASHELFTLGVLAIALGVAYGAAELFDVSFALGAFFAGVILAESELSHRAANDSLPLRDAFSVLFFVAIGMLFDPAIVVAEPVAVLLTVAIIVVGKSVAAYVLVRLFRHDHGTALTVSASLAQIGEFSYILAGLGVMLAVLPEEARDLILAGSILSILANPVVFALCMRSIRTPAPAAVVAAEIAHLSGHSVIVGFGRVGREIGASLVDRGVACVVIDDRTVPVGEARALGLPVVFANGAAKGALDEAGIAAARTLFVAIPNAFQAAEVVIDARRRSTDLRIIARVHSQPEADHLASMGADETVLAEVEVARGMLALEQGGPAGSAPAVQA